MYEFPVIHHISDVLPAIEGRDEFVVAEKDGYTVINYNVMMADTFPDMIPYDEDNYDADDSVDWFNHHYKIRRECRGIIFCNVTGKILRRPFHKFFNAGERDETQAHRINLSRPHAILEKLDGSMIAPFIVNGTMIWGTKMGATDVAKPVEDFVNQNSHYSMFANQLIRLGKTPIFEWCSRKQRIVLDYGKEDHLILTAIRDMHTGTYMSYEEMGNWASNFGDVNVNGGIPVVRRFEPQTDMQAFVEYVSALEDTEGFVVRFDDGEMVKVKSHWYVQIHKAKEAILQDRNIVELILEEHLDDVKAHLPEEDRDRLTQFENDINVAINGVCNEIRVQLDYLIRYEIDRKTFALSKAQEIDSYMRPIIFKLYGRTDVDQQEIRDLVANALRNNIGKTVKYEAIRDAWFPGIVYNEV